MQTSREQSKMPRFSIIIPVYRTEEFLPSCLDSVLAQTYTDYEVICVNDGSPDSCSSILNEYAAKSNKIRIITQDNQGLSEARNSGLREAIGEYIYFLDSDDVIHPQLLEITLAFAEKYQAEMICFQSERSSNGQFDTKRIEPEDIAFQVTDNPIYLGFRRERFHIEFCVPFKVFRRSLLTGLYFLKNVHYEDVHYILAVLSRSPKTVSLACKLYGYNIRTGSIMHPTQASTRQIRDHHTVVKEVCRIYDQETLKNERLYLRRHFIPVILNEQYKICRRATEDIREQLYEALAKELRELHAMGMLHWRGHKFLRYLKYRQIMKQYPPC